MEPRPRLRRRRGRSTPTTSPLPAGVRSALLAEPAHRGQPPALLPHDRVALRQRRRVGRVEPPLDGRRGPPLDRDPRLPHRDALDRPRARSSAPAWRRCRAASCPNPPRIADGIVYVALQELATRIAHRNTGKLLDDPPGEAIMTRVAADENLHHLFYRDLVAAALEIDPSGMVVAIDRQVRFFEMPGAGIPDFAAHARAIADVGVYDFASHHDHILVPVVVKHWRIEQLQNLEVGRRAGARPRRCTTSSASASPPSAWAPAAPRAPPRSEPAPSARRASVARGRLGERDAPRTARGPARRSGRAPTRAPAARRRRAAAATTTAPRASTRGARRRRRPSVASSRRAGPSRSPVTARCEHVRRLGFERPRSCSAAGTAAAPGSRGRATVPDG